MSDRNPYTRSIERAFDILECFLVAGDGLTLMDLANTTKLSPSTVHRLMATLESRQYVERNEDNKRYYLGSMVAQLGGMGLSSMKKDLRKVALPYMTKLSQRYNETVSLFVVDGSNRMCVERVETTHALRRVLTIGERLPLDRGATGRLLLAYLPAERVKEVISDYNVAIEANLQDIRDKGYALSIGEREEGLAAVAAPVFVDEEKVVAGLAMSGPIVRFVTEDMSDKIGAVVQCAAEISAALGHVFN